LDVNGMRILTTSEKLRRPSSENIPSTHSGE
jgi:hypothetical protein